MTSDSLVIGSGPAGLVLASALASRGASVCVLAPEPRAPWAPTYGVWSAHLPAWAEDAVERRFSTATVDLGAGPVALARAYARLDTARLQAALLARCADRGVRFVEGRADRVRHDASGSEAGGLRARLVIDASGGSLGGPAPTLFQTAYGILAEADGGADGLVWMDFSARFGDGSEPPTFLYAMPAADGRVFLEETSLAREGGTPFATLEARLHQRLAASGVRIRRVDHVERCVIALDRRPPIGGRTLAFGAAGGMVHPATGYLLGPVFAEAEPLADALLAAWPGGPAAVTSAGWAALWPADRRRRFGLYRFGSRAVSRMGADATRRFFAAFFASARWEPWLDDELSFAELAQEMARLFARLPLAVQARLVRPWPPPSFVQNLSRTLEER